MKSMHKRHFSMDVFHLRIRIFFVDLNRQNKPFVKRKSSSKPSRSLVISRVDLNFADDVNRWPLGVDVTAREANIILEKSQR